ncbi:MAG: hypothetical protein QOI20_1606 [Acidimicrobiaceae bacterium]|jgi:phage repressor protein C with HTH and peptisase S24 domain|nr:hypothetical protein [Acidimicrobiaceae bacterium]
MNKPWRRVEVHGDSMRPALQPGDRLLVLWWPKDRLRIGQLVAVRRPERVVVKRIAAIDAAAGTVDLQGDNRPASTDYRAVQTADVVGRAVYRYAPTERVGPLH